MKNWFARFLELAGEAVGKLVVKVPFTIAAIQLAVWLEWPQFYELPSPSFKQTVGIALLFYILT